jgi:hypothetical protein
MVNAPTLHRDVATNLLKTLPPEDLACTGDVFDTHKTIVVGATSSILKRRSHESQNMILGKLVQKKLKVVRIE